jgi:hypothetical protein
VRGPKIELKEVTGEATGGREANLELSILNSGDQPANDLQVEARALTPFLRVENEKGDVDLDPGSTYLVKLLVFTDENATPGYSPLPVKISYRDPEQSGQMIQDQDLALLVMVHKNASSITWLLLPAGLLLLLLLAGGYYGRRRFSGKKRKSRRITRG